MRCHVASTVRSVALRSSVLSLAKTSSRGSGRDCRAVEQQVYAGMADRLAHSLTLVAAEIVHEHDIAGLAGGDKGLLKVGPEPPAFDHLVEH